MAIDNSGGLDKDTIDKLIARNGFSSYHDGSFWITCCGKEIEVDGECQGDEYEDCCWAYCPDCQTSFDWEPTDKSFREKE